jgi:hypothetical protein
MRLLRLLPLLFLAGAIGARAADALVISPRTRLADPAHDPAWSALFTRLAPNRTRQSNFEERRFFSFRRQPVILKGEIRIVPGRGLSLRYLEPKPQTLIIDREGLLMRDEHGRERAAPPDPRARAATSALLHVLRFDLAALQQTFAVYGERHGEAWTLAFVPRADELAKLVGTLEVSGAGGRLDRIEMIKSPAERIEILISDTQDDVIFPAGVLKRFFR